MKEQFRYVEELQKRGVRVSYNDSIHDGMDKIVRHIDALNGIIADQEKTIAHLDDLRIERDVERDRERVFRYAYSLGKSSTLCSEGASDAEVDRMWREQKDLI